MAKRRFELPGIQDLSKEQEGVRALPSEGRHLIIGGPGTGKTVLALIRARRHQSDRESYVFLVYNHLLNRASGQLFGGGLQNRTWTAWFLDTFEEITGQSVPQEDANDSAYPEIDWDGVEQIVRDLPKGDDGARPFLVIDEGQDMPPQFYHALLALGFDRFFVAADQNQQIKERRNSSRQDIQDCLAIDTDAVVELKRNYRNCHHVARLAREFYTGDPASRPPEIPPADRGPIPLLYRYGENGLNKVAGAILRYADRDPRELIGIITPNNNVRERYVQALRSVDVQLDNARPPVATFWGQSRYPVRFDQGGILVVNAQACKGLEFDTVVLADIDEHYYRRDNPDVTKRLFYVMVARAKERVFMFMKRGGRKDIERILPTDHEVLRRKEL